MYRSTYNVSQDTAIVSAVVRRYVSKHARTRQNEVVYKKNDNVAATHSQKSPTVPSRTIHNMTR